MFRLHGAGNETRHARQAHYQLSLPLCTHLYTFNLCFKIKGRVCVGSRRIEHLKRLECSTHIEGPRSRNLMCVSLGKQARGRGGILAHLGLCRTNRAVHRSLHHGCDERAFQEKCSMVLTIYLKSPNVPGLFPPLQSEENRPHLRRRE